MSGIKGHKSQQRLAKSLKNYTEAQSVDPERFVTVQEMSGRRHALDVLIHGAYQISVAPITVGTGSNIRQIVTPAPHGASANDIIRLADGTEFSAISVPDANTIITSVELPYDPTGTTFTIWRHVTPAYNPDGSLNVLAAPSVIEYKLNGVSTQVARDTVTPANSRPLPVELMSASGVDINVTAGDINVEILHNGAAPSSVQIGDGTRTVLTTLANELKVSDATVSGQLPATLGQKAMAASMSVAIASDQSTVPVSQVYAILSTNNASVTPLAGNATFTGVADDTLNYASVTLYLEVDQNGSLSIQYSSNGTNWDDIQTYPITVTTPGVPQFFQFSTSREGRFYRVVYVNGATAQGVFRLQSILNILPLSGEVSQIASPVLAATDAIVTKGVIYGLTTGGGGGYVAVKVNPSGAMVADVTSNGLILPSTSQLPATLGQKAMAASMSVAIASDQSAVPVSSTQLPATLGAKTSALSTSVVLASDQAPLQSLGLLLTSAANSTTTPLLANATFTGASIDTSGYSAISVIINSDQASAANGVNIEYSGDGTNWEEATLGTFTPGTGTNTGQVYGGNIRARYARVVYTNGAVNQTTFRLSTTLRSMPMAGDIVDMEAVLGNNSHGIVTKGVITGKNTAGGGSFVDVKVNPSGSIATDATNTQGTIAPGTAPANSNIAGGVYNSTPPTFTNGQTGALQLDVDGSLYVNLRDQYKPTPTYAESLTVANTGVTTLTAPVGVKGCKVITPTGNTVNLHITLDGATTPTTTAGGVGMEIQPGRAEDFQGVGNLQAIAQAVATGQKISVHWYV